MTDIVLKIILPAVLTVCVGAITTIIFPFLQKKLKLSEKTLEAAESALNKENIEKITKYIEELVKSAEERGRNGAIKTGPEKFQYVFDLAKDLTSTFNISVPEDYLKALIDSKVTELIASGIKKVENPSIKKVEEIFP